MGERLKFETSSVEPRHRLDLWRSLLADSFAPCEVTAPRPLEFSAKVVSTEVDRLHLLQMEASPQTCVRSKTLMRSSQSNHYLVCISHCDMGFSAGGQEIVALRDSITLVDLARPYDTTTCDPSACTAILIPRDVLERVLGPAPSAAGLSIGSDQASGPTIRGFFASLMERGHLFDPSTAARMAAIGVDLLAAGFAERLAYEPRTGMGAAALVYRAKVFIEDHLWDSGLETAMVAAAVNLSVRRLQEVFAEQELTVDGYLWERRLARACTQLRDPAYDAVSIASIGYGVGFHSAAHFARRFRHRFAMSPTEYRERARLERAAGTMQ